MKRCAAVTVLLFAQAAFAQDNVKHVSAQEGMSAVFPGQFHATDPGKGCREAERLIQHLDASSSSDFQTPGTSRAVNARVFMVDNCTDPEAVAAPWAATINAELANNFNAGDVHTPNAVISNWARVKVNGYDAVRCALEGTSHDQKFTGIWLMVKRGDQMVMAMAIHSANSPHDTSDRDFIDSFVVTALPKRWPSPNDVLI